MQKYTTGQDIILHMSRQPRCRDMCKQTAWSDLWRQEKKLYFLNLGLWAAI